MLVDLVFVGQSVRVDLPCVVVEHYECFYVEEGHLYVSYGVGESCDCCVEYEESLEFDCGSGFEYLVGFEPRFYLEV